MARLKSEAASVPAAMTSDGRVPTRAADIRGPLGVYYYDHEAEALAAKGLEASALRPLPALEGVDGSLMEYEALNLADGKRSLSEIRDILTGRYAPVPLGFVATCFERWAQLGIVALK